MRELVEMCVCKRGRERETMSVFLLQCVWCVFVCVRQIEKERQTD